ncbi:START domain-containing protein [Marinobacter salicampi]|uniref:START domain-containing protein n=1 Tax=Marinobacter salicampi TaxID=435907 RepID=UPI00140C8E92|nr:START domain-containing protein [Marinobacter salicampi]
MPYTFTRIASGLMILGLALSPLALAELPAEDADWQLQKREGDIRIYTIDHPDSKFEAFKAEALLDAPLANVMAVMINPGSCTEWVHGCVESEAFGDGDFQERYAYSVNDMPWPVTDRDYVIRIQTEGDEGSGEVVMHLNAVPNMRDEEEGRIRVDQSDTFYRFTPQGGQTRMVWLQHTNPNGSIPSWLVNSLVVDIPLKSILRLEAVAQEARYQNHELHFDEEGNLTAVVAPEESGDDESDATR